MEHMAISEIDTLAQARHNTHVLPQPTYPPTTDTNVYIGQPSLSASFSV